MNAIELLEQQHRDIERLFAMINDEDDDESRADLFDEIADALAVHATIEERILYPEAKRAGADGMLRDSVEEHLVIKRLIASLLELDVTEETFDETLDALEQEVQHHVMEEEKSLFPKCREHLDGEKLEELGEQLEALAAELMEGEPRLDVPNQTGAPARL